jgi:hypothetical protein
LVQANNNEFKSRIARESFDFPYDPAHSGRKKLPNTFQIFWRINARPGGMCCHKDRDAVAMPHGAKLLKGFNDFKRCLWQFGELTQKPYTVSVDANVAQWCRAG